MNHHFFAMMSRMRYIERWSLMRNSNQENVSEHSLQTAMIAHALVVISNKVKGNAYHAERAALIGLYHDAAEIITGDVPTPIKYFNPKFLNAFSEIEAIASNQLLDMLPEYMRDEFESVFFPKEDEYFLKLIKAADKISALIKCMEERNAGNNEFLQAEKSTKEYLIKMDMDEVRVFFEEFLPSYELSLDELN